MSPELHIQRDLLAGQSTADSIAGRIGLPSAAVLTILRRLERENLVSPKPLSCLTVWRLTLEGKNATL